MEVVEQQGQRPYTKQYVVHGHMRPTGGKSTPALPFAFPAALISVPCPHLPPHPTRSNTQAIIYVVDSCDTDRLSTSRDEFQAILEEEELKDAVILVYANKQDLPGALSEAQVLWRLHVSGCGSAGQSSQHGKYNNWNDWNTPVDLQSTG